MSLLRRLLVWLIRRPEPEPEPRPAIPGTTLMSMQLPPSLTCRSMTAEEIADHQHQHERERRHSRRPPSWLTARRPTRRVPKW